MGSNFIPHTKGGSRALSRALSGNVLRSPWWSPSPGLSLTQLSTQAFVCLLCQRLCGAGDTRALPRDRQSFAERGGDTAPFILAPNLPTDSGINTPPTPPQGELGAAGQSFALIWS